MAQYAKTMSRVDENDHQFLEMERNRQRDAIEQQRLEAERDNALLVQAAASLGRPVAQGIPDDDTFIDTQTAELDPEESTETFSSISNSREPAPLPRRKKARVAKKKSSAASIPNAASKKKFGEPTTDTIFEAAEQGDLRELQRYIEGEGVSVNCHDSFRSTPLHLVCENGHAQAARYLVSKGGAVNRRDKWYKTPLHWAAQGGFADIVRILLEHGADVRMEDKWGSIPLQLAAEKDHRDAVSALIDAGSPVEHQDNSGKTAMSLCKDEVIRGMLQNSGAKPRVCFVNP